MTDHDARRALYPENVPPRSATLPYLYTAPIALAIAGALLVHWGPLAFETPWASPSLTVTHVVTLGFLTMVCAGVFTPLLALAGNGPALWHRATHFVYYGLVVGLVGFTYGTAQHEAWSVFLAIGAIGVMGVVFLVFGTIGLRRARHRGPTVALLAVALWGFFLAASLGIWLAHGHGGMRFPGPRPLWLQVHLSVALLGWIGASLAAVTAEVLPERVVGRVPDAQATRSLAMPIAIGATLPACLVVAQFFGAFDVGDTAVPGIAAITTIPALAAVWIVHPVIAWRSLFRIPIEDAAAAEGGKGGPGALRFMRTGFLLAPVSLALGVASFFESPDWIAVLFGWIAVVGWAGSLVHGVLLVAMPYLLLPAGTAMPSGHDDSLVEAAFVTYLGALLAGVIGIAFSIEIFSRLAGVLIVVDALFLLAAIVRNRRTA